MDLNLIHSMKHMRDTNSQVLSRRQHEAQERLYFGLACIEYSYNESFKRPKVLHEAASALIDAMTLNRKDPRAPFSLAYLFFLIEDFATAQEYLHIALSLEPQDEVINALQETLHQEVLAQKKRNKNATQHTHVAHLPENPSQPQEAVEDLDYDALYDRVEQELLELTQALTTAPPTQVASSPLEYKALKSNFKKLKGYYEKFQADLSILEEELDTDELQQRLHALEIILGRQRELLLKSESLMQLGRDLRNELETVNQLLNAAEGHTADADISTLENKVEVLLDNCDGFADRLDQFESQGIGITVALGIYENLVSAIEKLQDLADRWAEQDGSAA